MSLPIIPSSLASFSALQSRSSSQRPLQERVSATSGEEMELKDPQFDDQLAMVSTGGITQVPLSVMNSFERSDDLTQSSLRSENQLVDSEIRDSKTGILGRDIQQSLPDSDEGLNSRAVPFQNLNQTKLSENLPSVRDNRLIDDFPVTSRVLHKALNQNEPQKSSLSANPLDSLGESRLPEQIEIQGQNGYRFESKDTSPLIRHVSGSINPAFSEKRESQLASNDQLKANSELSLAGLGIVEDSVESLQKNQRQNRSLVSSDDFLRTMQALNFPRNAGNANGERFNQNLEVPTSSLESPLDSLLTKAVQSSNRSEEQGSLFAQDRDGSSKSDEASSMRSSEFLPKYANGLERGSIRS
jgi:hypothetical protein